ncbi:MAG: glycosyltransferase 87 family protein [Acidobacteria bacterium]|nr:glycosyltransferase 87 family protein [Acidobacteriota bacterium]MCL5287051.1 glycosyltransferase 87 family protein [Acidobacteriota bacterium]
MRSVETALQKSLAPCQARLAVLGFVLLGLLFEALRRLGDLKLYVVETIAIWLAAGAIYLVALYFFEASDDSSSAFWLILLGALLFRLTLFPLAPTLSDDIYRYRWEGRVQQAGFNPYTMRPDDKRLAHLRDADWRAIPGRNIPTIYPPLSELLWRFGYRFLPGPVAFKLPSLLADLLVVGMLAGWVRFSGGRNFTLAIYAWNPLVIFEFAASGHHDALAFAAVFAASLLIIRGRGTLSTLALAAGTLVKAFPIVLFPLWLRRAKWPSSRWGWLNVLAALVLAAACSWPYWTAWPQLLQSLGQYGSGWRDNNPSLYALLEQFSGFPDLAVGAGIGVVAGLSIWVAARRMDSIRAAYVLFAAILMLSPNANPWYFTWLVPFLAFFPNPAWLLLTVLQSLSYHVLIAYQASGAYHFQPFYLWLTYAPFYAVLLAFFIWPPPPPVNLGSAWQRAAFR